MLQALYKKKENKIVVLSILNVLGETGRIIINRTTDHCGKDKQSHLLKHALISNHPVVDLKDLKIIDKNYHGNKNNRKKPEALQKHSVQLKIFIS